MPPVAQTLFVTLVLGALGALTINVLRLSKVGWWSAMPDPAWGELVLAPTLGALAAFGIFLLGSSGLLLTSDKGAEHRCPPSSSACWASSPGSCMMKPSVVFAVRCPAVRRRQPCHRDLSGGPFPCGGAARRQGILRGRSGAQVWHREANFRRAGVHLAGAVRRCDEQPHAAGVAGDQRADHASEIRELVLAVIMRSNW